MSIDLITEKYRPMTVEDYVWRDPQLKAKVLEWVAQGAAPHVIFSGKAGTGKSSLAWLILKLLGVPKSDICYVNASKERKIDDMQDRIMGFITTSPMINNPHQVKYVFLEEADSMSIFTQKFLRAEFEKNTKHVRFFLTCNQPEKISEPIASRCQHFHFMALDQEAFIGRVVAVLEAEGTKFDTDVLIDYIDSTYPDLRKCLGTIDQGTIGGVLYPRKDEAGRSFDFITDAADLFRRGQHRKAREIIVGQASIEDYPDLFRFLYQNLELWSDDPDKQDSALIIIRDGLFKHNFIADPEMNLSATICELVKLK